MTNRQSIPGINTNVNSVLVSSQMQAANMQSPWRQPDVGGLMQGISKVAGQYYQAEKEAAFKRLDLEADKFQYEELEEIRTATSNEQIPQIEQKFQARVNEAFSQDSWGRKWLKERSELYFAANGRDVMRHGLAKQHELGVLELNKTIGAWTDNISGSAPDKAKVLIGDMNNFIDASPILSPEEKQKTKDNALKMALQRQIGANPATALTMLSDNSYKWGEAGIDVNHYKESALASAKDADKRRVINQINANRAAATDLINLSAERRLSLDEINARVPESSADLRQFLYSINGYSKSDIENGGIKLTEEQKAANEAALYDELAGLLSKKDVTIEDWQTFENKVYQNMNNKSVSKGSGLKLLDEFATPFMKTWQDKLEDAGTNYWISKDFGYAGLNNWIDKIMPKKPRKSEYKNNQAVYKRIMAGRDRVRTELYRQYNDALVEVAKGAGLDNVAAIKTLPEAKQEKLYQAAQDMVTQNSAQQTFAWLKNLPPEKQPNAVLNNAAMVENSNNIDNAKQGIPVTNTGFSTIGKYQVRVKE